MNRRNFVKTGMVLAAGFALPRAGTSLAQTEIAQSNTQGKQMQERRLA